MVFVPLLLEYHQVDVGPRISVHAVQPSARASDLTRRVLLQQLLQLSIEESRAEEIRAQIIDRSLEHFGSIDSPDYVAAQAPEWMHEWTPGVASDIEGFTQLIIFGGAQFGESFYLAYNFVNIGERGYYLAEFSMEGSHDSLSLMQTKFFESIYDPPQVRSR